MDMRPADNDAADAGMTPTDERRKAYRRLFDDVYDDAVRFAVRRAPDLYADDAVAGAMLTVWRRLDDYPTTSTGAARGCSASSVGHS